MTYLKCNDEVAHALENGLPVVALESTIISHGMPYPDNIKMAVEVEQLIRDQGAVPATIAVMDGSLCIGLSQEEIERLGTDPSVVKTSTRDLANVIAKKGIGATTVAATAHAAHLAGIKFFATGGLGGVHREAEKTFDISADLYALAQANICIVSAGVKSILDIPKTIELMETLGMSVYGYETEDYPGFYIRQSGVKVEAITTEELVDLLKAKVQLSIPQSVHVAVPIPESNELSESLMETIIQDALHEAEQSGIVGKAITPFLLSKIKEKTGGESLSSNIALMKNNAVTAAKIAARYHQK